MRQIFDINAKLELVGDYAFIEVKQRGTTYSVLALRYSREHCALYSINRAFDLNGSSEPRCSELIEQYPFLGECSSSWILPIYYSLKECCNDCDIIRRATSFTIVQDAIQLQRVEDISMRGDDSATSLVALPSEYLCKRYEATTKYRGMQGWHSHHGSRLNSPIKAWKKHRIGVEIEVEFMNEDSRREFIDIPSNYFYRETDGSLDDYGCEIITIPLLPNDAKDAEFWKELTDSLRGRANSWDTSGRCGLHVHIGREILGTTLEQHSETIGKLLYLYHHWLKDTRFNIKMYGRERGYHDMNAKTAQGDAAKMLGGDSLRSKKVTDIVKKAMISKSDGDRPFGHGERYFDINLQNEHTIEFRKGKGSINPKRIAMVVEYCELMCIYAKQTPWMQLSFDDFIAYLKSVASDSIKENIATTVF